MSTIRTVLALSAGLILASAAQAAPSAGSRAAAFQAVLDCRSLGDSAARLACYDAAAGRLATAETSGEIVVIDKEQAKAAHRQAFGLMLPSLDVITRGLGADEESRLDGVVRTASADAFGKWTIVLTDGAVWRQIADETINRAPKPGSKVTIRKATLGSFKMNVDGQPAIRVHRDR